MYFPYLRGRQFELIALKELIDLNLISNQIKPIVEPVVRSTTLLNTLKAYINKEREICYICNPEYRLSKSNEDDLDKNLQYNIELLNLLKEPKIALSLIIGHDVRNLISSYQTFRKIESMMFIIKDSVQLNNYKEILGDGKNNTKYNVISDSRQLRRSILGNKICIEDKFKKRSKNADYSNNDDEEFSDDHKFYREEGYIGFSDYTIVGEDFSEGGFSPRAVAIHIVYFDNLKNLRIHHCVSNTNDTASNPAKKYNEALKKLIDWKKSNSDVFLNTHAMSVFENHFNNGLYSGLGVIKKLSIMHHLELLDRYLNGELK